MIRACDRKIEFTAGDTGVIHVLFAGDIPAEGTTAVLTVRKTVDSEEPSLVKEAQVEGWKADFVFAESDTADLPRGEYGWMVTLRFENGDVNTPMRYPEPFEILPKA